MIKHRTTRRTALALALAIAATPVAAVAAAAAGSPPATPANVAVVSGNRLLNVSWTESSTGTITYTATATSAGHPTRKCVTKRLHCSIVSLINGVSYNVAVVAKNASGASAASAAIAGIPGVPSAPNSVHASASKGGNATIFWAPPKSSGVSAITGYTATVNPGAITCSSNGAGRSCKVSGLTKGTKYSVTVVATNKYGSGPASKAYSFVAK
jgi:hypothetical protein